MDPFRHGLGSDTNPAMIPDHLHTCYAWLDSLLQAIS